MVMEFSPAHVHPHEHLDPVLAFSPAGAGIDLQDGAQLVFFTAEHVQELKIFDNPGGLFSLFVYFFFSSFPNLVKLIDHRQIFKRGQGLIVGIGPPLDITDRTQSFLGFFGIVPEIRNLG